MTHPDSLAIGIGVVAGLVAGVVNAIAGGGSLVLYPALVAIGLPSVPANVTNSVALWPGYAGNLVGLGPVVADNAAHIRRLALPAIIGSLIGCALLLMTPSRAFDVIVPFLVIGASLLLAGQDRLRARLAIEHAQARTALMLSTGLAATYGGYFGGGVGVILLAVLGLTLGAGLRVANAVKGGLSLLINTVSVVVFALLGPVHWMLVLAIAPASLIGGLAGGRLAARVRETSLRRIVVVFGLVVGSWLAVRAFS